MTTPRTFGFESTALEVSEGIDLSGYDSIVTGGASGIGIETVRALAQRGSRVVLAARDLVKAEQVASQLRKETSNDQIEVEHLDLSSLASVRQFVDRYLAKKRPLHILINNAGVMACPKSYTEDGFEMQFGTNHIGHFVLTLGLLPALKDGYKERNKYSRVINVSSLAHVRSDIDYNDVNFFEREYDPFVAYGQSKTANILFSIAFNKHYSSEGVISFGLHPGVIMTALSRHISDEIKKSWSSGDNQWRMKTVEQGAATSVWAATAPELEDKGGLYLEDCQISVPQTLEVMRPALAARKHIIGIVPYARGDENAEKFWKFTEKLISEGPKAKLE